MRRQLGIRWKVLAVLALPVLVLALAAGAVTFEALRDARLGRQIGAFAGAQNEVTKVVAALQNERLLSTTAGRQPSTALRAARAVSDREIVALRTALEQTEITSGLPSASALIENVDRANRRVVDQRRALDQGEGLAAVRAGYSSIIAVDVELPGAVGDVLDDRVLARRFAATTVLGRAIEASDQMHLVGLDMVAATRATTTQQSTLAVSLTDHSRAIAQFKTGGSVVAPAIQQQVTSATEDFAGLATRLQRGGTGPITLTATAWTAAAHAQADALRRLAQGVAEDAAVQAESSAETTQQRAALVSGAAVALVGLMILLALMQSRQITAPLRRLAEATTRTREELPGAVEAITVRGAESAELPAVEVGANDEVGAVAAAFRDVQDTVIEIAHEQAELRGALAETFVNVARRNQVLLARQLSFIDRLERIEEDPDSLENLFRLDHLATRMRRNAESLLVLAGIDSGRRARAPMTLSDVVRTAISEVEHYERVQLSSAVNPLVVAHLSLPAAHLVAELIENATTFSDPAAKVLVQTAGSSTGVQIRVIDRGLGMTEEELADANRRVGDAEVSTLVPVHTSGAQRLGLYVVARLAARLGARVALANGPDGGTVATVELPTVVFVEGSSPRSTGQVRRIDMSTAEPASPPSVAQAPPMAPQAPLALPIPAEPIAPAFEDLLSASNWTTSSSWSGEDDASAASTGAGLSTSESLVQQEIHALTPPPMPAPTPAPVSAPAAAALTGPAPLPRRRKAPEPAAAGAYIPAQGPAEPPALPGWQTVPAPDAIGLGLLHEQLAGPSAEPITPVHVPPPPPSSLPPAYPAPTEAYPAPVGVYAPPAEALLPPAPASAPAPAPAPGPVPSMAPLLAPMMDVLPQHHGRGGFSLAKLGRRGKGGRGERGAVPVPPEPLLPAVSQPPNPYDVAAQTAVVEPTAAAVPDGAWLAPSPQDDGSKWGWARQDEAGAASAAQEVASRSDLTSTALSELSMLASYRPEVGGGSPATLTRRTPAATPAAVVPPPPVNPAPARFPRDADVVRATMTGFLAGASRGRGQGGIPSARQPSSPQSSPSPAAQSSPIPAPTPEEYR